MTDQTEEELTPDYCYACQFKTADLQYYPAASFLRDKEGSWFCKLCANTMSGRAFEDPSSSISEHSIILFAICYVGNTIMAELKAWNTRHKPEGE